MTIDPSKINARIVFSNRGLVVINRGNDAELMDPVWITFYTGHMRNHFLNDYQKVRQWPKPEEKYENICLSIIIRDTDTFEICILSTVSLEAEHGLFFKQ
jgi:hypothetical protein